MKNKTLASDAKAETIFPFDGTGNMMLKGESDWPFDWSTKKYNNVECAISKR